MVRGWRTVVRSITTGVCAALVVVVAAAAVGAQDEIVPFDATTGYDHVHPPPPGARSSADWCFSFDDAALIGDTIVVMATGPTGPISGEGVVGDDGTVRVRVGITQGGTYTVSSIVAQRAGRAVSSAGVESVDVVFDPQFVDCMATLEPPPTSAPTSSTTTSTTAPLETTAAPETTVAAAPPSTSGGGSRGLPLALVFVGLVLLFVGAFLFYATGVGVATTTTCEPERRRLARSKADLEAAREKLRELQAKEKELSKQVDAIQWDRKMKPQDRYRREQELQEDWKRAIGDVQTAQSTVHVLEQEVAAAQRALDACLKRASSPAPTDPKTTGTPTASTSGDEEPPPVCCPKGNWIGLNISWGGILAVAGVESGVVTLFCIEDPERMAVIKWSGTRVGLGLGGEASAGLFLVFDGGVHPNELTAVVPKIVGGWGWDISVGVSWTKLLKGAGKAGKNAERLKELFEAVKEARTATKALSKARKAGSIEEATKIAAAHAGTFKRLIREGAADDLTNLAAKTASSAKQAGGTGVNIPYGKGLQVAGWKLVNVKAELIELDGCKACDPSKWGK